MNTQISLIGYSSAAAAFAVLTGLLLTIWRTRVRGSLLTIASAMTFLWAIVLAYYSTRSMPISSVLFAEMIHDSTWLIFLASLLGGSIAVESNWVVRRGGVLLGLGLLIAGLLLEFAGLKARFPSAMSQIVVMGSIATSLYALVGIEQLYRNARPAQQNGLKFLCLALAGIFAFDIFLYSNAVVEGQIQQTFWGVRGFVVALCVPMIAVSVKRIESWKRGIFASRQVVFYTTTLFAAGLYLSLVGVAGYYIRTLGAEWGDALQLLFFSAAVLGFFALALSEQIRGRARVFISKHFFERKYDYRAEWLRLIHTLTSDEDGLPLKKRAIKSLAQIVGSTSGHLWLRVGDDEFLTVASWDTQPVEASIDGGSVLPQFLANKAWIVDVTEVGTRPAKYAPLTNESLSGSLASSALDWVLSLHPEIARTLSRPRPIDVRLPFFQSPSTTHHQLHLWVGDQKFDPPPVPNSEEEVM